MKYARFIHGLSLILLKTDPIGALITLPQTNSRIWKSQPVENVVPLFRNPGYVSGEDKCRHLTNVFDSIILIAIEIRSP